MEQTVSKQLVAQQLGHIIVEKVLQLDFSVTELAEFLSLRTLEQIIYILESTADDGEAIRQIIFALRGRGIIVPRHGFQPPADGPAGG